MSVTTRLAEFPRDFDAIKALVNESWDNLVAEARAGKGGDAEADSISTYRSAALTELASPDAMRAKYLAHPRARLWVAELPDAGVVGVVGCIPSASEWEDELVRMAVSKSARRAGVGRALVKELLDHCTRQGALRVRLMCASSSGKAFYASCGFTRISSQRRVDGGLEGFLMIARTKAPRRFVRRVVVSGGVHGNELVGAHLVAHVWASADAHADAHADGAEDLPVARVSSHPDLVRPTLTVSTVLANPRALAKCVRFVEKDLNRCFHERDLGSPAPDTSAERPTKTRRVDPDDSVPYEVRVARVLNRVLGPKRDVNGPGPAPACDLLIDVHGTTANMTSLIVLQGDVLHLRLFQHLRKTFPNLTLLVTPKARADDDNIDSVPPSGVCFELGPVPHGTLSAPVLELARGLVKATLDFLDARNANDADDDEFLQADRVVEGFEFWKTLPFPRSARAGAGTQSPAVVVSHALHPDRVGKDFARIERGDPVFVSLDDPKAVVAYDEDEPAYPVFIGEAAYFTGGTAMGLCRKREYAVY